MKNPFRRRPNLEEDGCEIHRGYIQLRSSPGRPPTPESLKDPPRRDDSEAEIKAAYERAARAEVDAMMMARKLDVTLAQLAAVPTDAILSLWLACSTRAPEEKKALVVVGAWLDAQPEITNIELDIDDTEAQPSDSRG